MSINLHIFDLDGVISNTAVVHERAWINLGNEICRRYGLNPPYIYNREYYLTRIDGKSRLKGLQTILSDLEIKLEGGEIERYMTLKEELFFKELEQFNKTELIFDDALAYLEQLQRTPDVLITLATSSLNGKKILSDIGLSKYFHYVADGKMLLEYGLDGKPSPDIFNLVIREYDKKHMLFTTIYEDSESGVSAALQSDANEIYCIERYKINKSRSHSNYMGDVSKLKKISSLKELM